MDYKKRDSEDEVLFAEETAEPEALAAREENKVESPYADSDFTEDTEDTAPLPADDAESAADDAANDTLPAKRKRHFGKKQLFAVVAIVLALIVLSQCLITVLLYRFALTPGAFRKSAPDNLSTSENVSAFGGNNADVTWLTGKASERTLESADGLKLHALFLEGDTNSHSYAVLLHPYSCDGTAMASYARHYSELGFRVLLPDARGHGKSEGNYIGMGWDDRLDVVKWIASLVQEDPAARILVHGVSMGGSTAAMVSGEALPENVRCIIDDCGYSSVWEEFRYQLKSMFSLPAFPVLYMASAYTQLRAGWNFKEASALAQVEKSKTPTLFIHGEADDFVPASQGNALYDACAAEKKQLVIPNAPHAQSAFRDPQKYWAEVDRFMLNHFGL